GRWIVWRCGGTTAGGAAEHVERRHLETADGIAKGEVQQGHTEAAEVQELDRSVADGLAAVDGEPEAPVGISSCGHNGVQTVVVDGGDRLVLARNDRHGVRRAALAVENLV